MDNNVSTLNCPACGAALELDGSSPIIRCKFCGNVVQISGVVQAQAAQPAVLPPAIEEIRQLARSGKMLEAIKRYRAIYGVGLAEAKSDIEALQANRWVAPRRP
jgi:ribosomal protein L37AE/L43A